jgi:hypothetical protein
MHKKFSCRQISYMLNAYITVCEYINILAIYNVISGSACDMLSLINYIFFITPLLCSKNNLSFPEIVYHTCTNEKSFNTMHSSTKNYLYSYMLGGK